MSRANGKSPLEYSELTFPIQGEEPEDIFTQEAADELVGQYTDFHGYEARVTATELTEDGKVVLVTIKVPTRMLKALGILAGNERFTL